METPYSEKNMNNPLISVIIPVYNVEQYLPRCLDSVLIQTYCNLEIILVDDGSKDRSGVICDEFATKDSRIKVFHQKNAGVSCARNVGLDIACGDYVGFIDSDDYIESDFYEVLVKNAVAHNADISYCGIKLVEPNGSVHERFNTSCRCEKRPSEIIKGFFFNEEIKEHMYSQCNKIFKREVLAGVRYKEGYALGEDILFVFETLGKCNMLCLEDRTMYHYLRRENSAMTSAFSDKRMDYIKAAEDIVNICENNYDYAVADAKHWAYIHKLITCRQLICNPEYYKKHVDKFNSMKKELLKGMREHFKRLNRNRKMDFFLVCYFPYGYTLLKKIGKI